MPNGTPESSSIPIEELRMKQAEYAFRILTEAAGTVVVFHFAGLLALVPAGFVLRDAVHGFRITKKIGDARRTSGR